MFCKFICSFLILTLLTVNTAAAAGVRLLNARGQTVDSAYVTHDEENLSSTNSDKSAEGPDTVSVVPQLADELTHSVSDILEGSGKLTQEDLDKIELTWAHQLPECENANFRRLMALARKHCAKQPLQVRNLFSAYLNTGQVCCGLFDPTAQYFCDAVEQVALGEYTKKNNGLGLSLQLATAATGIDAPGDIRDLSANIKNWEWTVSHACKTGLNGLALLPVVGALKYTDEAADLAKSADKAAELAKSTDKATDLAKGTDKVAKTGEGLQASKGLCNPIHGKPRVGSALKNDRVKTRVLEGNNYGRQMVEEFRASAKPHGFTDIVDNYASEASSFKLDRGAVLYQLEGSLNGALGRFEWIVQDGEVTHRMFVRGGVVSGVPIKP